MSSSRTEEIFPFNLVLILLEKTDIEVSNAGRNLQLVDLLTPKRLAAPRRRLQLIVTGSTTAYSTTVVRDAVTARCFMKSLPEQFGFV